MINPAASTYATAADMPFAGVTALVGHFKYLVAYGALIESLQEYACQLS